MGFKSCYEQAMLLVHLALSIVPEKIIPEMQEENVMERDHTWSTNRS
jgi:hypothetical protein